VDHHRGASGRPSGGLLTRIYVGSSRFLLHTKVIYVATAHRDAAACRNRS
jgi:hypothetical protein